jgi:hypothetical protein
MAFGFSDFNIVDTPAMQRQMQRVMAMPNYNQALMRNSMMNLYGQQAAEQFAKTNASFQFKTQRDASDERLDLSKQRLDLARQRQDAEHNYRMKGLQFSTQALRDRNADDTLSSYLGLGSFGFGLYSDRQEAQRQAIRQKETQRQINTILGNQAVAGLGQFGAQPAFDMSPY